MGCGIPDRYWFSGSRVAVYCSPAAGLELRTGWAYLLFIACAGITLISSASGTRQRIELSKRIKELEKKLEEQKSAQNQTQNTSGPQFISKEHLVGSVN